MVSIWWYDGIIETQCTQKVCIVIPLIQPPHTIVTMQLTVINQMHTYDSKRLWHHSCFTFFSYSHHALCCLLPFIPHHWAFTWSLHLLSNCTIFISFSLLHHGLMNSGCVRCGVQSFSLAVLSPAGFSHSAPNASPEYWINPGTSSVFPDLQH